MLKEFDIEKTTLGLVIQQTIAVQFFVAKYTF
jgi:hypothetical protein